MYKRVYPGPYGGYRPAKRFRSYTPKGFKSNYARQNKSYPRGPSKMGTLTQQVKSLQKFVDRMKPEKKYFETDISLANITDAAGGIVELTAMAAGDTGTTRTGNQIHVTDIRTVVTFIRGSAVATPDYNASIRWAIVQDTQQEEDTDAAVVDIFSGADPVGFPVIGNLDRYRVLYLSPVLDAQMMGMWATANILPTKTNTYEYLWTGNIKVGYNGSAVGDIQKNGLYFVVLVDGFSNTLDCSGFSRIGFTDN